MTAPDLPPLAAGAVKRYGMEPGGLYMTVHPDGPYIRYPDHAAVTTERDQASANNARLAEELRQALTRLDAAIADSARLRTEYAMADECAKRCQANGERDAARVEALTEELLRVRGERERMRCLLVQCRAAFRSKEREDAIRYKDPVTSLSKAIDAALTNPTAEGTAP